MKWMMTMTMTIALVSTVMLLSVNPSVAFLTQERRERRHLALRPLFQSPPSSDDKNAIGLDVKGFSDRIGQLFRPSSPSSSSSTAKDAVPDDDDDDDDDDGSTTTESSPAENNVNKKFDNQQRLESLKSIVLGALAGGILVTPVTYLHYVDNFPQWEFTTDMAGLQAGLFAVVYRYAVRTDGETNPMLNQGVVGAFAFTRTLANVHTSPSCVAIPLQCGPPLGYVDWNMLTQIAWNGAESAVLFGAAAVALEVAFGKGWIEKFG